MNNLEEYNPERAEEELLVTGKLACTSLPTNKLQLGKSAPAQLPAITLQLDHLIELITCPGEVRGSATGWCGPARISLRTASLLNTTGSVFKSLYILEGPLTDKWGLKYYALWHRLEYEEQAAQRKAKAAEWEAAREKNAIKYNMLQAVVNSVFTVFQKVQGVSVAKRTDAEEFVKLCIESGEVEPLLKHGFKKELM